MNKNTSFESAVPVEGIAGTTEERIGEARSVLDQIVRDGACKMLQGRVGSGSRRVPGIPRVEAGRP